MLEISERLMGSGVAQAKINKAAEVMAEELRARESAAGPTGFGGDEKADHKQQMRDLKRRLGNMLLLAPCLLNSWNMLNLRIILAVGQLLWSEQTYCAVAKCTAP
jgi:hypothetical protein